MTNAILAQPEINTVPESRKSTFWAVTLLVSGSCIGGGMLALPVQTANAGFMMSFFGIIVSWLFMTYTGLLLVEATLWVKNETHFGSLSRIIIGNKTKILALIVYIFMNYASLVAYTAGGANLIGHQISIHFGIDLSYELCCVLFTFIFGSMLWLGAHLIGNINSLFMVGLILTYFGLIGLGINHINPSYLGFLPPLSEGLGIFSMILATFSYQMVVPSLCLQLDYDAKLLKKAVIFGTTIPFVAYSVWVCLIHGVVPLEGTNGLLEAYSRGASATEPLRMQFDHWALTGLSDFFAFFALVTSYLGLSVALFYFLKDCFKELHVRMSKNTIILTTIIPTMLLAILFPNALITCLDLSGGLGDTILSGLIPIALVWMGRYKRGFKGEYTVPGGKAALIFTSVFYVLILFKQFL